MWKTICKLCEKEFTSEMKERAENDLITHHLDVQRGKHLDQNYVKAILE